MYDAVTSPAPASTPAVNSTVAIPSFCVSADKGFKPPISSTRVKVIRLPATTSPSRFSVARKSSAEAAVTVFDALPSSWE